MADDLKHNSQGEPQAEPDGRKGEREDEREDERGDRHAWFIQSRRHDANVPRDMFARASAQKRAMLRHSAVRYAAEAAARPRTAAPPVPPYWTPLGPSVVGHGQAQGNPPVSGRIKALAVGPGGTRVYAGAANGGIWYSEDSGASWTPIDEYAFTLKTVPNLEADSLSTGAITVMFGASGAADTIYVGTGEPDASDGYFGVGIKSATSGGFTPNWILEGKNLAGMANFRIAIAPDKPSVVLAATTGGLFVRPATAPFDSWIAVTAGFPANVAVTDLVVSGTGASQVWFAAVSSGSVYFSTDVVSSGNGGTWTPIPGFTAAGRVALAISQVPASGTPLPILYALVSDASLHRFDTAQLATPTRAFQTVLGVPRALFAGGQGGYDIVLAVDPSDPNTVYMAGDRVLYNDYDLSIFKGLIAPSGSNYSFPFDPANDIPSVPDNATKVPNDATWIGEGIHPDAHCLAFATNADGTHDATNVWVSCDGGIFQSTQSGKRGTFQSRNVGLAVTEMTFIAQHPDTDAVLYGGAQDQGNLRFRGDAVCYEAPEGDGGGVAFDPNNGWQIMRQYIRAALSYATDGGASDGSWKDVSFPGSAQIEDSRTGFYGPLAAFAKDSTHTLLAFGTNRLWLTEDWGSTWKTIPSLSNGANLAQDVLDDLKPTILLSNTNPASFPASPIVALAWASPTRIFVATRNAVWQFDLSGGNWTPNPPTKLPATNLPAGAIITALAVEDGTKGTIYATLGGGGVDHVWYFDPAVGSWTTAQLTAATLDVPVHAIVVDPAHPEHIYIGTDVGVLQGVKTGANWDWTGVFNLSSATFPECAVTCLAIHPRTRVLRAATHGLGVWEIALDVTTASNPDLYLRVNAADSGRLSGGARPAWLDGVSDPTIQGATLTHTMSPDIKALRSSGSTLSTAADLLAFASFKNFAPDLNTVDTLGTNQLFVEVHNRGLSVSGDQVNVLLLLADGSIPAPALPADFITRIQGGDKTTWLGSTGWYFADATNPFRTLPGAVDARHPQVVQYNVDISVVPNSPGKIYAAAFVTTDADPLSTANTDINALVMADKHAAIRTLDVGTDWRVVLGVVLVLVGVAAAIVIAEEV